jgi:nitrite reductase/ring-hydroxylating ferredoxin subunit
MSEQSEHKNPSSLGRRRLLMVGSAGLAAAALPACAVAEFQFAPAPDAGEDAASPQPQPSGSPSSGPPPSDDAGPPVDASSPSKGLPDGSSPPPADAAPPPNTCSTNANTLVVALSKYPQLATVGGSAMLSDSRYSDPVCQGSDFYVVQTSAGTYAAYSAWCTHACGKVSISGATAHCPCHGATFNVPTGDVTKGPAKVALPSLPVCSDGTSLYIQLK